jgi:hypothetical protein
MRILFRHAQWRQDTFLSDWRFVMANGHGGARPGAGRKIDPAPIEKLRALTKTVMSDDVWVEILTGVVDDARSGDLRSVAFLLALRYGISTKALVAAEGADLNPAPAQPVVHRVQTP